MFMVKMTMLKIVEEQHDISGKKKCARAEERTFDDVDRWDCSNTTNPEILNHIRKFLDDCNHEAGILHVPGAHKDRPPTGA